jgi:hypothetical protein
MEDDREMREGEAPIQEATNGGGNAVDDRSFFTLRCSGYGRMVDMEEAQERD